MPEGDTILWAATRMRPVLEGHVPDERSAPAAATRARPLARAADGRAVEAVETHGKHLFLVFEGGLVLHSHLRMTGAWECAGQRRQLRRPGVAGAAPWRALRSSSSTARVLELLTDGRRRFDQRLAALGPDLLAAAFDPRAFLARLRDDDPTRAFGEALLDQRNLAGIGNIWKSEACWEARIDPRRPVREVSDDAALRAIEAVRPRMLRSGTLGPRSVALRVYDRAGRPCSRCGEVVLARGLGDDNRTTYWCPRCQA